MRSIINKTFLLSGIFLASTSAFASFPSNDFKVSAKVTPGCLITADDVNFGELNDKTVKTQASQLLFPAPGLYNAYDSWFTVHLQCSKKQKYTLIGQGFDKNLLNGATNPSKIQYFVWSPSGQWFGTNNGGYNGTVMNYSNTATGNVDELKFYFAINMTKYGQSFRTLVPDTYSGEYTITVSY